MLFGLTSFLNFGLFNRSLLLYLGKCLRHLHLLVYFPKGLYDIWSLAEDVSSTHVVFDLPEVLFNLLVDKFVFVINLLVTMVEF